MFIYTFKASKIKFFAVVLLAVASLLALITLVPGYGDAGTVAAVTIDYNNIKTDEDRIGFIESFGYTSECEVRVPDDFDTVYTKYNDLQRSQGLNLKKYAGKSLTRYSYYLTDYSGYDGKVMITLLVYKNRIVGGDVCGVDGEGFERINIACPRATLKQALDQLRDAVNAQTGRQTA